MRAALLAAVMALAVTAAPPLRAQPAEVSEDIQPDTPMKEPIFYIAQGDADGLRRLASFARKVGFRVGRISRQRDGGASMRLKAPAGMTYGDAAGVEEAVLEKEFGEVTLEGIVQELK